MSHACTVKYAYYMNMPPQSSYLIDGEYKEGGTVIKKELISLGTHSYSLSRFIEQKVSCCKWQPDKVPSRINIFL